MKIEYMYILRFPEEKDPTNDGEPWSIRQYAFYHQLRLSDKRSIFVLIGPMEDSDAAVGLEEWMRQRASDGQARERTFEVNEVLLTHLHNWRLYTRYYEGLIDDFVSLQACRN